MGSRVKRSAPWVLSFAFALFAAVGAVGQMQTMAIPTGIVAEFAENASSELIRAFCIDRGRDTPLRNTDFTHFSGTVRLTFDNGSTAVKPLNQAIEISIHGASSYERVKLTRNDPHVTKVEFLETSLAHSGSAADFQRAETLVPKLSPILSRDPHAPPIWSKEWDVRRSTEPQKAIIFDNWRRDPDNTLSQKIYDLGSRGDSAYIQMPTGPRLLIDTGEDQAAMNTVLPPPVLEKSAGAIPIDMLLTHQDRDHIGNALGIINNPNYQVDHVVLSEVSLDTKTKTEFVQELASLHYQVHRVPGTTMTVFERPGGSPFPIRPKSLVPGLNSADLGVRAFEVDLDSKVEINILQVSGPRTPNQSSIITEVTHNGYTTLYLGDADITSLNRLLKFAAAQDDALASLVERRVVKLFEDRFPDTAADVRTALADVQQLSPADRREGRELLTELLLEIADEKGAGDEFADQVATYMESFDKLTLLGSVDAIKWPHHAWLPSTQQGKQVLTSFLKRFSPTRVFLSTTTPELRGQSILAVQDFVHNILGSKTEVFSTGRDGTIQLLTLFTDDRRQIAIAA